VKNGRVSILFAAALGLAACTAPLPVPAPPPVSAPTPPPAPAVAVKPDVIAAAEPRPAPVARLAPLNPLLETWKQRAAERIYEANRKALFEGRPEHLLRAVVVVELAVDREGKVTNSKILRSPGIGELDIAALRSLRLASPLPVPPPSLLARGTLVYHETWLFRKDGRFQLRSLALPQE
jgi:protein TonB